MSEPRGADIWELGDLETPWCIYTAVTLHIAELIAGGNEQIDNLARAAGCDRDALHAILGHLVITGIFEEPIPGRFILNAAAKQLLDPVVQSSFNLNDIGGRFTGAWSTLLAYAQTGKPAYAEIFGASFWEDLARNPKLAASFDAIIGPAGHGTPSADFEISGGWEAVRSVVDVGGGTGAMLAEILREWPHIEGILVDQPATVRRAEATFQDAGVTGRVRTIGQSFFDPLPAGADLYLLRGILNDWPDQEAVSILKRCAEASRAATDVNHPGRVVVLKSVGADDAQKDLFIEMVLLGGKHRTITEFSELAHLARLEVTAFGLQPSGTYVVECRTI